MFNTFGHLLKVTSFGESHGPAVGVVVDGFPAGIEVDTTQIQQELDRRRPGQSKITTARKEEDQPEILSGVFDGKSTGAPITILIRNKDAKGRDYEHLKEVFRPSHADFTYEAKYGNRDYRGGGRSSARITAGWVAAGALAKKLLAQKGQACHAFVSQVGDIRLDKTHDELDLTTIDNNIVRCPDPATADEMIALIERVKKDGDTIGGVITGLVQGSPTGLGEPLFGKLGAELGKAMLSINAAKGFELGSGFSGATKRGSEHNDPFETIDGKVRTSSNHAGGLLGGITTGEDIYFNVAFKPVATIMKDQASVDKDGQDAVVKGKGRHDPCVVPRAVPIVEAMSALVIADFYLIAQTNILRG